MRVCIDRLGINGEGIAKGTEGKYIDKVCFVKQAISGEIVDIEVLQDKKSFCIAKLNNVIKPSMHRVVPACKYFGVCGGCDIQHIDKNTQQIFKSNKVKETIQKISKINLPVKNVVRLNDFAYRNKMVFPIVSKNGQARLGMFKELSHSIVDIDNCLLCKDIINRVYSVSKNYLESSEFKGYDFKLKKGDIKYLVIRTYKDDVLVTLVTTKKINLEKYYQVLENNFQSIGLSLVISDSDSDILSGKYIYINGLKNLQIEEFGIKYSIDNRGFMQINDEVKRALYSQVLEYIDSNDEVIDCYSGAGLMSAIVARKCRSVTGIEINKSASDSAKKLAKENHLNNIRFINDDVKNSINNVLKNHKNSVVILDPPRSGCGEVVLNSLLEYNIDKIIYISCNASTLARDLGILNQAYEIVNVQPWDMFPQTKHVETLVCLKKRF